MIIINTKKLILSILGAVLFAVTIWILLSRQADQSTSDFSHGDEGWRLSGDVGPSDTPLYESKGGNPAGYIYGKDEAVGGVWFWLAPEKFYGDRLAFYEGQLFFDLKQSSLENQFDDEDVVISDGTDNLAIHIEPNPGLTWTNYTIPLTSSSGWVNLRTDTPATETEIRRVLSKLRSLYIRGEFIDGEDIGGLDNVQLAAP